jgi:hypothetical protein
MAKEKIQNGQAEYGVVHVMEEEMRAAGQGVFEEHSSEAGMTKAELREARKAAASPETKMEGGSPANKSAPKPISRESMTTTSSTNRTAAKRKGRR